MAYKFILALVASLLVFNTAFARNVEVGPIWNQSDAQNKCAIAAAVMQGRWTGHWSTTVAGKMSVCSIVDVAGRAIEAGPIWSQADAEVKCPMVATIYRGTWTRHWWTTKPSEMSVCFISFN